MDKFPETVDDFLSGQILLINKPLGWTSFDVVRKIKNLIRIKYNLKKIKVGHAGTLDPLASGLLIVCTGKFTKRISELQGQAKIYTGDITLGGTTPS
jgi:tRNA pseudouridine55 synthase